MTQEEYKNWLVEKKKFDAMDIDKDIEILKKQIQQLVYQIEDLEDLKTIKQRMYGDKPTKMIALDQLKRERKKDKNTFNKGE